MTFTEWVVFHTACGIVQAACLLITVSLADDGRLVWALLAGIVGLIAAHAESYIARWA